MTTPSPAVSTRDRRVGFNIIYGLFRAVHRAMRTSGLTITPGSPASGVRSRAHHAAWATRSLCAMPCLAAWEASVRRFGTPDTPAQGEILC